MSVCSLSLCISLLLHIIIIINNHFLLLWLCFGFESEGQGCWNRSDELDSLQQLGEHKSRHQTGTNQAEIDADAHVQVRR